MSTTMMMMMHRQCEWLRLYARGKSSLVPIIKYSPLLSLDCPFFPFKIEGLKSSFPWELLEFSYKWAGSMVFGYMATHGDDDDVCVCGKAEYRMVLCLYIPIGTDYCATEGHRCHSNATCVNLRTTFTCQCKEGFTGDGLTCEDMDECLLERNHCARNTRCVNTLGGYACECFNGFKKINAFQCEDQDECAAGFPNDCSPHATCTNTKGSYTCTCNSGYTGSGYGAAGCARKYFYFCVHFEAETHEKPTCG